MQSGFFIHRPIFASVLSILVVLLGLGAMRRLPVERYPNILPPQVEVTANYPGASAEVVAESVAAPLEQQINGAAGMIYMSSTSNASGGMTIVVTFKTGSDPDQALIDVNNRVQAALPTLPEDVRRLGVLARKSQSGVLGFATLSGDSSRYDIVYVTNYAQRNVVDALQRVPGVGTARLFGAQYYAMRIWLDPQRLNALGLTPSDVAQALSDQNAELPAGSIGAEPLKSSVDFTFTMITRGRLFTPEQFGEIAVRRDAHGGLVRIKDVARVELGAENYAFKATLDGKPAVPIGIYLQPGANSLEAMDGVRRTLADLSADLPAGLHLDVPYDSTEFVRISIREVVETLAIAFVLVFAVTYLFLGNWRATLIPALAVPVSLIGTFGGLYVFGFSINTLTLFGMVLAIGIVVDDAIVVLENVERIMHEEHVDAAAATAKTMQQVTGPVIAIVLVLAAVFVPIGFLGGLSGVMYKQFAITIAVAVAISGFVALTLTPALCANLLRAEDREEFDFLHRFSVWFQRRTEGYTRRVTEILYHRWIAGLTLCVVCVVGLVVLRYVPGALVPDEDQGFVITAVTLPDAASLARTTAVVKQLDDYAVRNPLVSHSVSLIGLDFLSGGLRSSSAAKFVRLRDWKQRRDAAQSADAVAQRLMAFGAANVKDARVLAFNPPAIFGLSTTGGFDVYVQSRTNASYKQLAAVVGQLLGRANKDPQLANVFTVFSANTPQIRLEINRDKAAQMGVSLRQLFAATQSTFAALYVNDFNREGRTFHVLLQAEGEARARIEDLRNVTVRSAAGDLVPLTALVTPVLDTGPELVDRFNGFQAVKLSGSPRPGVSSGAALKRMEEIAREVLPDGYTLAWTGSAYQEKAVGNTALIAVGAGLLVVFLVLAAQFERWTLPLAVVLSVPFAMFGALAAVWLRGQHNDIYFQVGLVTLIGLSAKNAILIIAFAARNLHAGMNVLDAAVAAARQRFRPIVMTSFAFIFGVLPLALGRGAGAGARHSIGTGVIGGMLAATLIATLFIPTFFRWVAGKDATRG
ncbi:MAG: multidrug efflux RND transporter permease subunit [Steroidobacteraceae bacterium]